MKGTGVRAKTSPRSARLRFLATSDLQPRFRLRQPLDGKAVPVVVSPGIAAAAGPSSLLPVDVEGTPVLTRRRDGEPLPLHRRRLRRGRTRDAGDGDERRPSRYGGYERGLARE